MTLTKTVGSDVAGLTTTATKAPDGRSYLLSGEKKWVTQGCWATHGLVAARTGGPGHKGISCFMVDMASKGISRRKMVNSGVSSSGSAFVEFDEVRVPADNLLGHEGQGFEIIMSSKYTTPRQV